MIDTFVYSKGWISSIIVVYERIFKNSRGHMERKKPANRRIKPTRCTNPMESIQDDHKSPPFTKHEFSIYQIQKINYMDSHIQRHIFLRESQKGTIVANKGMRSSPMSWLQTYVTVLFIARRQNLLDESCNDFLGIVPCTLPLTL